MKMKTSTFKSGLSSAIPNNINSRYYVDENNISTLT